MLRQIPSFFVVGNYSRIELAIGSQFSPLPSLSLVHPQDPRQNLTEGIMSSVKASGNKRRLLLVTQHGPRPGKRCIYLLPESRAPRTSTRKKRKKKTSLNPYRLSQLQQSRGPGRSLANADRGKLSICAIATGKRESRPLSKKFHRHRQSTNPSLVHLRTSRPHPIQTHQKTHIEPTVSKMDA
ncbi:uncharacterized protein LY79DRAFT_537047 [Colletotrichum navitas]|uniref:Uncharacterized protein n=1 Tax=Colletotrichum navitas TaxID=681940 RepID=A0AAD8QB59_9PEZI|nr:uncharacterized protein LY79DRAFT_537047 [Colletotrichum navitas]KAK1599125.1 hypothetical protein LY79DRAFT_537047 [Colletotrichum navitas]